jgi:ACS family D-galactonate transporter-like MFS transporter
LCTAATRGATLLTGCAPLGAALGGIVIAGLIAALGSWRLAFIVAGGGTMACGLLAWWYIRNSPREHPMVSDARLHRASDLFERDRLSRKLPV